ncbi:RES family NAD+ phosphorylase [Pseudomonas putida]
MANASKPDTPTAPLHLALTTLAAGTLLHRVHHNRFGPTQYNPTGSGNARFSPIKDKAGQIIPTLYAGSTFHCAAMETIFHDVPYEPGIKIVQQHRFDGNHYSILQTTQALRLVDLSTKALRRLGVQRSRLIDTNADEYPFSRQWAEAIHAYVPDVHGLRWVSRQDDEAVAFVLFGDRLPSNALSDHDVGRDVLRDAETFDRVLSLAELIGVLLLPDEPAR